MIGGSLFYDFARVGATPAPFQSFVLSAGVVTDYVYGAGVHWQGGCGGFPCDGSGSLNEWNAIQPRVRPRPPHPWRVAAWSCFRPAARSATPATSPTSPA